MKNINKIRSSVVMVAVVVGVAAIGIMQILSSSALLTPTGRITCGTPTTTRITILITYANTGTARANLYKYGSSIPIASYPGPSGTVTHLDTVSAGKYTYELHTGATILSKVVCSTLIIAPAPVPAPTPALVPKPIPSPVPAPVPLVVVTPAPVVVITPTPSPAPIVVTQPAPAPVVPKTIKRRPTPTPTPTPAPTTTPDIAPATTPTLVADLPMAVVPDKTVPTTPKASQPATTVTKKPIRSSNTAAVVGVSVVLLIVVVAVSVFLMRRTVSIPTAHPASSAVPLGKLSITAPILPPQAPIANNEIERRVNQAFYPAQPVAPEQPVLSKPKEEVPDMFDIANANPGSFGNAHFRESAPTVTPVVAPPQLIPEVQAQAPAPAPAIKPEEPSDTLIVDHEKHTK